MKLFATIVLANLVSACLIAGAITMMQETRETASAVKQSQESNQRADYYLRLLPKKK